MMNDRFSAQLRQHLLETSNDRPADGQLAALEDLVAVTAQRRPVVARLTWLPSRLGPVPSTVARYGLIAAALLLAALVGAILAGGSSPQPSTPFEGTWTAIDQPDGSTLNLYVGAGQTPAVRYEDLFATGDVCVNDLVKVFRAEGTGRIVSDRLEATFPNGGCGLATISLEEAFVYDPDTGTLLDQHGFVWTRVPGGDAPVPSLPPTDSPSPLPRTVFEGTWTGTDPGDESTLTLVVGSGPAPDVQFQDALATGGVCVADEVKIFRADGDGEIAGNLLEVTYPDGGGCGSILVAIAGRYDYDANTDTLLDADGVRWTRVTEPAPSLRPAPTAAGCVDRARGGTYAGFAGGVLLRATIPAAPEVPWQGLHARFQLSAACADPASMEFHADGEADVNDGTCMPSREKIEDFADAVARLDAPQGNDISERIDLTIDGHAAARYDITELSTCSGFGLWTGTIIGAGSTGSIYVIDVDGVLLEIELNRDGSQTQAELEEAHAIIASLQIGQ